MQSERLYDWVGTGVARASDRPGGDKVNIVCVSFPKEGITGDELDDPDNYVDYFITLAAAKTLIIDLQSAVDDLISGEAFK